MSYLDVPRMNFFGSFQADVSTINNRPDNYDNDNFKPEYQQLGTVHGGWNPEGTGAFRLVDCRISGARLGRQQLLTAQDDPVIGLALDNGNRRVSAKLVDLDPDQQMASMIWGMQVRLVDADANTLFHSEYEAAPFCNVWLRQNGGSGQPAAAIYQTVLREVDWQGAHDSALLRALREASDEGWLSMNMNLYGYVTGAKNPRYTLGRVAGSIGPYRRGEPRHYVAGRQMLPSPTQSAPPVSCFACAVNEAEHRLSADFGNCLELIDGDGGFTDTRQLLLALDKGNADGLLTTVAADSVELLGEVDYARGQPPAQQNAWYAATAGIVDLDYSAAGAWAAEHIAARPLLLLTPVDNGGAAPLSYQVVVQESLDGLYARSDAFVFRLNPGEAVETDFYISRYGRPHAATLSLWGRDLHQPGVNGPLLFPHELVSDAQGKAVLAIGATPEGPGQPRPHIDGQVYFVHYQIAGQPRDTVRNPHDFISVLAFSKTEMPPHPSWYPDIQPIFQQYANLYPIMSRHLIDLGDYESVLPHLRILDMAFSLPRSDPNHMPVTRDLSSAKRDMILRWLREPGPDGLPRKGQAPAAPAAGAKSRLSADTPAPRHAPEHGPEHEPADGKTAILRANKTPLLAKRSAP